MEVVKQWVQRPDKPKHRVETIACHEDYIGNSIAEGRLAESEYWPTLVAYYKADLKHCRKQILELKEQVKANGA